MRLLTPFALVGTVIAVPIVLMYVLKLRRQDQLISSTFLWQRAVEDIQANVPWQRLRPNVLLLLQLLALAALILALAQPAYTRARAFQGDIVVIVDQSYSMQARDVIPSRFAEALARAHRLAADLTSGNVMSVIGMGAQPRLAIAESDDQGAVGRAIDSLRVGTSSPNFLAALSLAASLARNGERTQVVVLTSRDSGIAGLPLQVPFQVEIDRIGGRLRDLGITGFWGAPAGHNTQAVLRIHNFGARRVSSDLDLFADGQLADVRPISVNPGQDSTEVWTHLPSGIERLEAHLAHQDDVLVDKTAWAVVPRDSARHVLLVSNGNYFLETALAVNSSVQLQIVRPADYTPDAAQGFDLVIFDGALPQALPNQSTLLLAPNGTVTVGNGDPPLRFGAERNVGAIAAATSGNGSLSTLLQYVDFSDVHVAQARDFTPPAWLQPVLTSGGRTLLAAGEHGGARLAVVNFDLQESDWPLRISFPITIQNVLHFLAPGLALGTVNLTTGQHVKLFPEAGTREIQIVHPNRTVDHLHPPFAPFTDTSQPGLYQAQDIGAGTASASKQQVVPFAVNFFPTRATPTPGPEVLHLGQTIGGTEHRVNAPISVAWAFGLLALALLTLEWWYGFRR